MTGMVQDIDRKIHHQQPRRFDGRYDRTIDFDDFGQLAIPIAKLEHVEHDADASIQERFEAFHEANPWVLDAFIKLTEDWVARGRKRVGMKMLAEIVRWEYGRQTKGDEFRLNNSFTSRYSRLLAEKRPDLAPVFETRALRA